MAKYNNHVTVGDFKDAVENEIDMYVKELQKSIPDICKQAATKCVQSIRVHAVMAGIPDREYSRSWKKERITENAWGAYYRVWSPKKYRIAHLLEHGHTKVIHGKVTGTVRAYPHLCYAEQESIQFLENMLKKAIQED